MSTNGPAPNTVIRVNGRRLPPAHFCAPDQIPERIPASHGEWYLAKRHQDAVECDGQWLIEVDYDLIWTTA